MKGRNDGTALTEAEAAKRYKARQAERVKNQAKGVSQQAFLKNFHLRASAGLDSRIELLRWTAENVIFVALDRATLQKRRRAFDSCKNSKFSTLGAHCWVCGKDEHLIRHHIVLLKHGGSPQSKENIIFLCGFCHAEVHPWLFAPSEPVSAAEFRLAQAKAEVNQILEKAARGKFHAFDVAEQEIIDQLRNVFNNLAT